MIRCRRALVAYHATHAQAKANIVPAGGASERDTHSALQPMPHYLANPARTYGPHHRSNTHTSVVRRPGPHPPSPIARAAPRTNKIARMAHERPRETTPAGLRAGPGTPPTR
jgi:hypothetical protein